jgi:catechol 2,3-dioxygenase-like lactoylglutathione lyase family enzyme
VSKKRDPATVTGLAVVAIYAGDIKKAMAFYVDQLGFEVAAEMPPGLLLSAGELTVYLEGGRKGRANAGLDAPTTSACFTSGSVKATWERLRRASVPVIEVYKEPAPGFAMFRVEDPDGNVVEVAGAP